jgi:hypothetical protein
VTRLADLAAFLANLTEGAGSVISIVGDVGASFMEPPYVLVPICGTVFLGYKIGMYILKKVKNGA